MRSEQKRKLQYCVWELTLACDARCIHCGSAAGATRENELSTSEAVDLIGQLKSLGAESLTFSGGEPFLRADWPVLADTAIAAGIQLEAITNGLRVAENAEQIAGAGFHAITFSIDGAGATHDELRGVKGGLSQLLQGAQALKGRGVTIGAVTQINKRNWPELGQIHALLGAGEFDGWQLQLTMPTGRARTHRETLCLPPEMLPEVEARLLELQKNSPFFLQIADNIGYMGPGELRLRQGASPRGRLWGGCQAGLTVVGLTSDGTVRGCLSMPPDLDEDNVRYASLADIWQRQDAFSYNRCSQEAKYGGTCRDCSLCTRCRGGCKSLAFSTTGDVYSNPYCLRRIKDTC